MSEAQDSMQIILPQGAHGSGASPGSLDEALRLLTFAICAAEQREMSAGMGGAGGYGADYENSVFEMHPEYWGDCICGWGEKWGTLVELKHAPKCDQVELEHRSRDMGIHWSQSDSHAYEEAQRIRDAIYGEMLQKYHLPRPGCAVHCTCTRKDRLKELWEENKLGPRGHAIQCPIDWPNFRHKESGLEIEWYKWIGRDMRITNGNVAAAIAAVQSALQSLADRVSGDDARQLMKEESEAFEASMANVMAFVNSVGQPSED